MKIHKVWSIFSFAAICALASPSFGQQRVFNWLPGVDERVRLDPANYHSGRTYDPGAQGGNMHVVIKSQLPVTIFMTNADAWSAALQHPEQIAGVRQVCPRNHVTETTYTCELPPEAMTLVIQDERISPDHAVFTSFGSVLHPRNGVVDPATRVEPVARIKAASLSEAQTSGPRPFVAANRVHIQYFGGNAWKTASGGNISAAIR